MTRRHLSDHPKFWPTIAGIIIALYIIAGITAAIFYAPKGLS